MFTRAYPRNKLPYCLEKAEMPVKKESASCGKTNKCYYNCNKSKVNEMISDYYGGNKGTTSLYGNSGYGTCSTTCDSSSFRGRNGNDGYDVNKRKFINKNNANKDNSECLTMKEKICDFSKSLLNERMHQRKGRVCEYKSIQNQNVNVNNIRYIDVGSNNYFMACRPRYENVMQYNTKAQGYFKGIPITSKNEGCSIAEKERIYKMKQDFMKMLNK